MSRRAKVKGSNFGDTNSNTVCDALAWVKEHLPNGEFGLFVDFISILALMGTTQVEMLALMRARNNTQNVKLNSLCNSKIITSFQKVLPDLLGNAENATFALPRLNKHEKWEDLRNGIGMYGALLQLVQLAEEQLQMAIQTRLKDRKAKILALSTLEHLVRFFGKWRTYINTTYNTLVAQGKFPEALAWQLTCKVGQRVFDKVSKLRHSARMIDIADEN
jgi:hypothetical protein